jgi:hypothetical protein
MPHWRWRYFGKMAIVYREKGDATTPSERSRCRRAGESSQGEQVLAEELPIPEYVTGHCPPNLGFREERVREVYAEPDLTEDISYEGILLRMFMKSNPKFTDVVCIRDDPPPKHIAFAVRAFAHLTDSLSSLTPLSILESLADRFGLEMTIAGECKKFFLQTTLAVSGNVSQPIQVKNPGNHSFVNLSFIMLQPPSIKIALAFCLDTVLYGARFNRK